MYIRHLIDTRHGRKIVDFKQVLCVPCTACRKEVPHIFFGHDPKSICAVEAVYKYTSSDIIEEYSTTLTSMTPAPCNHGGCTKKKLM